MSDKRNPLLVPAAVIGACLVLFLVLVWLATRTEGGEDVNPAVGFPIVLVVLGVLAVVTAVVWRVVARRKGSPRG